MKSIIVPLNQVYYNWEKYNGSSMVSRFWERNKRLKSVLEKSRILHVLLFLAMLPLVAKLVFNYFGDKSKKGKPYAHNKVDEQIELVLIKFEKSKFIRTNDLLAPLESYRKNGYHLFVYYTDQMIPAGKKDKLVFQKKLKEMEAAIKARHVFHAHCKDDIEKVMLEFNVDVDKSFFMSDGEIDFPSSPQLDEWNVLKSNP